MRLNSKTAKLSQIEWESVGWASLAFRVLLDGCALTSILLSYDWTFLECKLGVLITLLLTNSSSSSKTRCSSA
jgi:hypothetical protein